MNDIEITKLKQEQLNDFREIKLESLKKDPLAFDSSYEAMNNWSKDMWGNYLNDLLNVGKKVVLLVYIDGSVCGFSVLEFHEKKKKHHIGDLLSLYVGEKYRRKGVARILLNKTIKVAKELNPDLEKIELYVYSNQEGSLKFYVNMGFETVGFSKKGLKYIDKYYDQILMDKLL